jgi:hypothetical protein
MTDASTPPSGEERLKDLQAAADHAQWRHQLYKAKIHGPRATSPGRLRELERESERASSRLRKATSDA